MDISELFGLSELESMIDDKMVSMRGHRDNPALLIFNYTPQAAYSRTWNDVTEICRGLIARNGKVIARPFRKFFNIGERPFPAGRFSATEKADGSLGIAYMAPNGRAGIATRGSFHSEQAEWATQWLRKYPDLEQWVERHLAGERTPLFEIVYPENRIVLDYHGFSGLIQLAVVDNATGQDFIDPTWPDRTVETYTELTLGDLDAMPSENKEGFVLKFEDGTRLKWKFEEYIRLHKILTGVTERTIWDMLSKHTPIATVAGYVPDEFYRWMQDVETDLNEKFSAIERECLALFLRVDKDAPRKEQAEVIKNMSHSGILFAMLDGKPYSDAIWKMIYPPVATPRLVDEDSDPGE